MTGVYYADLFKINGRGCLIMGFGKSKTCRHYTGEHTVEICSDSIRLENKDNKLIGYADPTMGWLPFIKEKVQNTQIEYIVRMLNEKETAELKCNSIMEIGKKDCINFCDFNITYGVSDENERRKEFETLIENIDLKCILVPWCVDMQAKGKMLSDYIK